MTTTIDNNQRRFLVQSQGHFQRDVFCNLEQIPEVLKELFSDYDEYKILEYFNRKLVKCSKKHLNAMFEAHKVNFKIK